MSTIAAPNRATNYTHLVSDELWARLTGRIVKEHNVSSEEAEDIMDAALGFLKLCADYPKRRLAPSQQVDIGWHTFILYTRSYAAFCDDIAGRFIHHEPNDIPGQPMDAGGSHVTVAFMMERQVVFNPVIWNVAADCKPGCSPCPCTEETCQGATDCDGGNGPAKYCTCS